MTGWKSYVVGIGLGLVGGAMWGGLIEIMGSPPIYGVIGAMIIALAGFMWARQN